MTFKHILSIICMISVSQLSKASFYGEDRPAVSGLTDSGSSVCSVDDSVEFIGDTQVTYLQVKELSDLRVSGFGKRDIVIFGEDPGLYDPDKEQLYPWLLDFIGGLNNSGAHVISLINEPPGSRVKSDLVRDRLVTAGLKLSSVLEDQEVKASLAESHMQVNNGVVARESFYRLLLDFNHLVNVLSVCKSRCDRIFYFDSNLEVQQMLWKEEFLLPVTMIYRLTRDTLYSPAHLRFTLLKLDDWKILLRQRIPVLSGLLRSEPKILNEVFQPFDDIPGLAFWQALVIKGKAKSIYKAFRRPSSGALPFISAIQFMLDRYIIRSEAYEGNHFHAYEITSWIRKLAPALESMWGEHVIYIAKLLAEENATITVRELLSVMRLLGEIEGDVCKLYPKDRGGDGSLLWLVFERTCADRIQPEVIQYLNNHVYNDPKRKVTELFTLVRYFRNLPKAKQSSALLALDEIVKRQRIKKWKPALKQLESRQEDVTAAALLNMDGWLTDTCNRKGDAGCQGGYFLPELCERSQESLKQSVILITGLVDRGVLTHANSYPLSYQLADLLIVFGECRGESDRNEIVRLVVKLHAIDRSLLHHPGGLRASIDVKARTRGALLVLFGLIKQLKVKGAEVNGFMFYRDLQLLLELGPSQIHALATKLGQGMHKQQYMTYAEISNKILDYYNLTKGT